MSARRAGACASGVLFALLLAGSSAAAPTPRAAAGASRPAAHRPAGRGTATRGAAGHVAAPADSAARARAPRTLEDIHIEGEIPVPQVLFITARDQRRFMEFQHHRYPRTSLELGRATPMPTGVVVTTPTPGERKEIQR